MGVELRSTVAAHRCLERSLLGFSSPAEKRASDLAETALCESFGLALSLDEPAGRRANDLIGEAFDVLTR